MEVVTASLARTGINILSRGREDPLPWPFAPGARVLPLQRVREFYPTRAGADVGIVLALDGLDMGRQLRIDPGGDHRSAIARAFAASDDDLMADKIDILDSQTTTLEQA